MSDSIRWTREFPAEYAVPEAIQALAREGKLTDCSWHNDVCPHFMFGEGEGAISFWTDHPDAEMREWNGMVRFVAYPCDADGDIDWDKNLFSSNDEAEAIAYITSVVNGEG